MNYKKAYIEFKNFNNTQKLAFFNRWFEKKDFEKHNILIQGEISQNKSRFMNMIKDLEFLRSKRPKIKIIQRSDEEYHKDLKKIESMSEGWEETRVIKYLNFYQTFDVAHLLICWNYKLEQLEVFIYR